MHEVEQSDKFKKAYAKLEKRDHAMFEHISKKLKELSEDPERFKPLRNELAGLRRLHFGSNVLIYRVEEETVFIISIEHHDDAY